MAAPATTTTLNMNGTYTLNKKESEPMDKILELAGVGWLARKAVSHVNPVATIKHIVSGDGVETIEIHASVAGGKGRDNTKVLDGTESEREDPMFGPCLTSIKRIAAADLMVDFLKQGWTADTLEHGLVVNTMKGIKGNVWHFEAAWGFAEVAGERKHVRKVHFTAKDGQTVDVRSVYDYTS